MKKRLLLLLCCLNLLPFYVIAQTKWKPSVSADLYIQAGGMGLSEGWQLKAGIQKATWVVSAGTGQDNYRYRSVPVVMEGMYFLTQKSKSPFFLAAAGINIPEKRFETDQNSSVPILPPGGGPITQWKPIQSKYSNGLFTMAGVGYSLYGKRKHGLQLKLLHSLKSTTVATPTVVWNPSINKYETSSTKYQYNMFRVVFSVGYKW